MCYVKHSKMKSKLEVDFWAEKGRETNVGSKTEDSMEVLGLMGTLDQLAEASGGFFSELCWGAMVWPLHPNITHGIEEGMMTMFRRVMDFEVDGPRKRGRHKKFVEKSSERRDNHSWA